MRFFVSIITISREAGSLGDEIAERISQKTGYPIIDFDKMISLFLNPIITEKEKKALVMSSKYFFEPIHDDQQMNFKSYLEGALREWANVNHGILLGIAGHHFLSDFPEAIHLRIIAEKENREQRLGQKKKLWLKAKRSQSLDALKSNIAFHELNFLERFCHEDEIELISTTELVNRIDRQYRKFSLTLFHEHEDSQLHYHTILNTSQLSFDLCVNQILFLLHKKQKELSFIKEQENNQIRLQIHDLPVFKNSTEEEFAKLLDLYHIEWKYEPKFFPIEWDDDGNVTMAFSPDFYLPKFNIYLELTTMNQRYVSAKKKKLSKLKELYPGVNVKIIFKRDFESLIQRFED